MAETISVASQVLDKLTDESLSENPCLWGVKGELIQKLERSILRLKDILPVAAVEEHRRYAPVLWELNAELNAAFHEVDDMLNYIVIEKSGKEKLTCGSIAKKVNPLVVHRMIGFKMRVIRRKLEVLEAYFGRFHDISLFTSTVDTNREMQQQHRETTSDLNPCEIIGRDEEKEKIIQILTRPTHEELQVIPIVGIGGLGKTTLAQLVFNDERVLKMQFELRLWACVSKRTDGNELVNRIIGSLGGRWGNKKNLLVLDDVVDIDRQEWISLKRLLVRGGNGSKIIVTTCRIDVAEMMGTVSPFGLQGLSFQDSLSLFLTRVGRTQVPDHEEIGKQIVTKCGGVPLAVMVMGDILCKDSSIENWNTVRDCEIWEIPGFRDRLLSVLKLSYDRMPYQLRQCFKFCSFFPKDYEFNKFELIYLLEAFAPIPKATGMEYLKGLWSFSLLKKCKGEAAFSLKV